MYLLLFFLLFKHTSLIFFIPLIDIMLEVIVEIL